MLTRSVVTLVLHCFSPEVFLKRLVEVISSSFFGDRSGYYSAATSRCYLIGYSVLCLLSRLLSHLWPIRPFDLRAINRNLSNVTTLPIMHANSPCLHLNFITAKLFFLGAEGFEGACSHVGDLYFMTRSLGVLASTGIRSRNKQLGSLARVVGCLSALRTSQFDDDGLDSIPRAWHGACLQWR